MKPNDFIDVPKLHFNFSDLLVDFFGCLIPGFVYLVFLFIIFFAPAAISHAIGKMAVSFNDQQIHRFMPFFATFIFLFSYILGHFFYRLDPKNPDQESYWFVRDQLANSGPFREYYNQGKKKFCVDCEQDGKCINYSNCPKIFLNKKELKKELKINSYKYKNYKKKLKIEYPYNHLIDYLKERGFNSLVKLIPWNAEDHKKRSKHFINTLKIRIAVNSPNNYSAIARNEAHIRLMSSVWYMMKTLQKACLLSFGLTVLIVITKADPIGKFRTLLNTDIYALFLISPIILLVIFYFMLIKIKRFYHYQRIREIVFVLETAYFIDSTGTQIFLEGETYPNKTLKKQNKSAHPINKSNSKGSVKA